MGLRSVADIAAAAATSPLLLRHLITPLLSYSVYTTSPLHLIRHIISTLLLFLLSFLSFLSSPHKPHKPSKLTTTIQNDPCAPAMERALTQLLTIVNDIPVSSRKYEAVRSLIERIVDENLSDGSQPLRELNRRVLSAAFEMTLGKLEAAAMERRRGRLVLGFRFERVMRGAMGYLNGTMEEEKEGEEGEEGRVAAEKMAAELLWIGRKLAECGGVGKAVERWAGAGELAWMALGAETRLQGSLVRVAAFLIKEAKDIGEEEGAEVGDGLRLNQMKLKLLLSWLPLLCRANNGTDAPILSTREREEVERVLEETIEMLERQEDREKVLSTWLHHFTHCPGSDWPNLFACYARWCTASRNLILMQQ
ncbi:hypothetical protein Droror1_Dr00010127 [Drosera rotundifolia]